MRSPTVFTFKDRQKNERTVATQNNIFDDTEFI